MKQDILKYLACPKKAKSKACRSSLVLDEVFSFFPRDTGEVREGYLKCKGCGSRFPVFFGIPVLTSDLSKYLRDNFCIILELSKRYGGINKNLIADSLLLAKQAGPKERREVFAKPRRQYARRVKVLFENNYIASHYDNFLALARPEEPLYDFLKRFQNKSPHRVLMEFLARMDTRDNHSLALEIGCGVGGFLKELSENAGFVFGLDISFEHLFFTSCLLKHLPVRIGQYRVIIEAGIKKRRSLDFKALDNLALIAGEGDNLPFKDSSLSIAASCNLIDVIDNPLGLVKEKIRVLKKKGLFLSSDPYQFLGENKKRLKIKKGQSPWQRLQEILRPKIKILEESDYIPWITRGYQRHYNIYYNHSFCGRKV